jgi:hypothetical protein
MLSTARTAAGERARGWLLAPGELAEVRARQEAVAELRRGLDLREEIALMGEHIRAAIDDRAMAAWGEQPPRRFFPGARLVALGLAVAAVATLALFLAQQISARPLLVVVLAELIFGLIMRDAVRTVVAAVSTPARELRLLGLLLERLERELLRAPHLTRLARTLDTKGRTASAEIRRLERMVDQLDSARNQFFRLSRPAGLIPNSQWRGRSVAPGVRPDIAQ